MLGRRWIPDTEMADALASEDVDCALGAYKDHELSHEKGYTLLNMGRLPAAEYERFCRRYGHEPDGTIPFRVAQDHYRKLAEQDPKAVRREWFRRYRPKEQAAQEQLRDRGNGQGFLFG